MIDIPRSARPKRAYRHRGRGDGVEALEKLKTCQVPNMDRLELLSKLKASDEWKSLPVVMVSTEGSQSTVLEALEKGAAAYVRKLFNADQIKEELAKFL